MFNIVTYILLLLSLLLIAKFLFINKYDHFIIKKLILFKLHHIYPLYLRKKVANKIFYSKFPFKVENNFKLFNI